MFPGVVMNFHLADALFEPLAAQQAAFAGDTRPTPSPTTCCGGSRWHTWSCCGRHRRPRLPGRGANRGATRATDRRPCRRRARLGRRRRPRHDRVVRATQRGAARPRVGARRLGPTRRVAATRCLHAACAARSGGRGGRLVPVRVEQVRTRDLGALESARVGAAPAFGERSGRADAADTVLGVDASVLLGASYGVFGGGQGQDLTNYGNRFDGDAIAYWQMKQLGFGDVAARNEARSQVRQANVAQMAIMDQVCREVIEAHAQVESRRGQIEIAREGIAAAERSQSRNLERIRNLQGLPLEMLQSNQALAFPVAVSLAQSSITTRASHALSRRRGPRRDSRDHRVGSVALSLWDGRVPLLWHGLRPCHPADRRSPALPDTRQLRGLLPVGKFAA